MRYSCRFIDNIAAIAVNDWNALAGKDYPFTRHEFLHALEISGSLGEQRGWVPHHCLVESEGLLVAVLPLYIKTHSYGEYVFDWSWADAYHRHGIHYYPKLVAAIPFTPATGPRLCHNLHDAADIDALIQTIAIALNDECVSLKASGWHVLFNNKTENKLWEKQAPQRTACHFQWFNRGFESFDHYLSTFSSRKRKNLKKERRTVEQQGIQLQRLTGKQITAEHWQLFYHFYQATYAKRSGHGGYLTSAFFQYLQQAMAEQVLLVIAYKEHQPIAAALNFFSSNTLYGRYWGTLQELDCLHFETCYYQGIEFCIEQGLHHFDPGVQGEHKIQRGFEPVLTYSNHQLMHNDFMDAIKHFLDQEKSAILEYRDSCSSALPFKQH